MARHNSRALRRYKRGVVARARRQKPKWLNRLRERGREEARMLKRDDGSA